MPETHENAGVQPDAASTGESHQQDGDTQAAETAAQADSDGWGQALEAFEEADSEIAHDQPQPSEEAQTQESESSHFEQDTQKTDGDLGYLDKLRVPPKFKGRIHEFINPLIQEHQHKAEAAEQQAGQYLEASRSFLNIFREVAKNPAAIAEYVEKYGEQIGLEPDVIQGHAKYRNGRNAQGPQAQKPQATDAQNVEAIFGKYAEKLVKTKDPQEFVASLRGMIADTLNLSKSEMTSQLTEQFKQMLGGYHEKFVNPNLKTLEEAKAAAKHEAVKGKWNEAGAVLKSKYNDFDQHYPEVRKLLREDPIFSKYREALNTDPELCEQHGITYESLFEKAYQLASRQPHIDQARKGSRNWEGVLSPSAKHITTQKAGGSDWEEIRKRIYGD